VWKSIVAVVFSLLCLAVVTAGTSEAKGRPGGGGRSARNALVRHPKKVHHQKHHKKHKKHDSGGGIDADFDAPDLDTDGADGGGEAEEAEEMEAAVYGVEITALYKGTGAEEGLEIGDIILSFNGTPTPTFEALASAVARSGTRAQVVVIREDGGARETVTLFPRNGLIGLSGERARVDD
jgi:membrane-associated protease RseP (regulator of RpoE activity)